MKSREHIAGATDCVRNIVVPQLCMLDDDISTRWTRMIAERVTKQPLLFSAAAWSSHDRGEQLKKSVLVKNSAGVVSPSQMKQYLSNI